MHSNSNTTTSRRRRRRIAILRSLLVVVVVVFSSGNQHTRRSVPVRVVTAFTITTTAAATPGVGRGTRGPSASASSIATTTLPATTEKETVTGSRPDAANPNHRNEPQSCATTDATTTTTTTIRTIPWLIVGGGINGVHVAARLMQQQQQMKTTTHVEEDHHNEDVCIIIDDNPELLSMWKTRTAATGMDYLRSSAGYHLDIHEQSLRAHYYATAATPTATSSRNRHNNHSNSNRNLSKKRKRKQNKKRNNNNSSSSSSKNPKTPVFANDYERPTLAVFNTHCAAVIAKYQLQSLHVRGTVTAIAAVAATNETETTVFEVEVKVPDDDAVAGAPPQRNTIIKYQAHNIVLAVGNAAISYENTKNANNTPAKNPWIDADDIEHGYVRHIFDDENTMKQQQRPENHPMNEEHAIAVVGNGISAVHKVLALVKQRRQQRQKNKNTTKNNNNTIYLISKNPDFILQQFDTHQDWMMDRAAAQRSLQHGGAGWPRRVQQFHALGPESAATKTTASEKKKTKQERYAQRRQIIQHERRPGTITAALYHGTAGLASAIHKGEILYYNTTTILNKRYIDDESDPDTEDDHTSRNSTTMTTTTTTKKKKRLELTLASPSSSYAPDGITTTTTTSTIIVDEVILATGFGKQLPGGKLITDLIDKYAPPASSITATSTNRDDDDSPFVLEVSEYCGYPIVDQNLCWTKLKDKNRHQGDDRGTGTGIGTGGNIYVTGALAELELGPSARNIAGARLAAERILQHASLDTKLNELK